MRASFLSTLQADALELGQHVGLAGLLRHQHAAAVADRFRRDVLVGRRVLGDGGGMNAGLGGEGAFADIGRVAVGRAVEPLVERVRDMRRASASCASDTPISKRSRVFRLQLQRRDDGNQIGVAAALAQAVERALDLARAGAHRGEGIGHRLLGVVVGVDGDVVAGDRLAHRADDRLRPRAAACRHWCRTAPPSARLPHRPPWRRPAHSPDWPCSRRRSARSRAALPAPWPWPRARCRGWRRGFPRRWSPARP